MCLCGILNFSLCYIFINLVGSRVVFFFVNCQLWSTPNQSLYLSLSRSLSTLFDPFYPVGTPLFIIIVGPVHCYSDQSLQMLAVR
jgi:hypothetical protein